MQTTSTQLPSVLTHASRRKWLKGFGAIAGLGLLGAPISALASPAAPAAPTAGAAEEALGTVKLFAGPQIPLGWVPCDGRLLRIGQHPALFAALGTTYGGDGARTFALPKLHADAATPLALPQPAFLCAVKVASAAAAPHAVAELRLAHQRRPASPAARRASPASHRTQS